MLLNIAYSAALRVALTSLVLSGLVASAEPTLSVTVSGPDSVTDVDKFHLDVTLTNTGQQSLKLINEPRSPLRKSPTDSFLIASSNGTKPTFIGISVKYAGVEFVAANGTGNAFTILAAGKSVVVKHDLSKKYNFKGSGSGKYTINTNNIFYYVDNNKRAVSIKAITKPHQVTLQGKLSVPFHEHDVHEFATFSGCTAAQQTQTNSAITAAKQYVTGSHSFLQSHSSATVRFTTWFGAFQTTRYNVVLSNFNSLLTRGTEFTGWSYDCSLAGCDPGDYAWVNPNVYGEIHLCDSFWTAPTTGTNSKAGTLVHEGTHFVATAGTQDIAYGQADCKQLAINNPNQAIRNADSYEYFAENTPPLN